MSTRYVWERFSTKQVSTGWVSGTPTRYSSFLANGYDRTKYVPINANADYYYSAYEMKPNTSGRYLECYNGYNPTNSMFPLRATLNVGDTITIPIQYSTTSGSYCRYLAIFDATVLYDAGKVPTADEAHWELTVASNSSSQYSFWLRCYPDGGTTSKEFYVTTATEQFEQQKDKSQGLLSTANSSGYPANGTSGSYWYVYKGSDSIDATKVEYASSIDNLHGGDSVTVTLTPATNSLGGTVSYQWYYNTTSSTTSGWTKWGDATTATSKTYTIPRGTQYFNVRVQAMDNLGFTSTDYTTAGRIAVTNIQAYIGIDGKARKVKKIYIGVDGKAREVKGGYIGVDGRARRWF